MIPANSTPLAAKADLDRLRAPVHAAIAAAGYDPLAFDTYRSDHGHLGATLGALPLDVADSGHTWEHPLGSGHRYTSAGGGVAVPVTAGIANHGGISVVNTSRNTVHDVATTVQNGTSGRYGGVVLLYVDANNFVEFAVTDADAKLWFMVAGVLTSVGTPTNFTIGQRSARRRVRAVARRGTTFLAIDGYVGGRHAITHTTTDAGITAALVGTRVGIISGSGSAVHSHFYAQGH